MKVKIDLKLSTTEINLLWTDRVDNFIGAQRSRFELIEGDRGVTLVSIRKGGTLFFCDHVANAILLRKFFQQSAYITALLADLQTSLFVILVQPERRKPK